LLQSGADKVSVNSASVRNPSLIEDIARAAGSQCCVVAIDTKKEEDGDWWVYLNGGRLKTDIKCREWAKEAVERGAGEILLTSMNNDGSRQGFALDITKELAEYLPVPVIASGGAGTMQHFADVFQLAHADAALAAGIFHFKEMAIKDLKMFLKAENINVRL